MGLGKQVRLNRLFAHASGRLCSVAVDHFIGYQEGLPAGLVNLPATIADIVAGAPDAITMHKGVALSCWPRHAGTIPLIVQSIIGRPDDSADEHLAVPEDAVRLGAEAFATCAFVRGASEAAHLRRVADFVRRAEGWEMPVILHIYPRKTGADGKVAISFAPEDIAWAVRCAVEAGVDVIKVPFTGDAASFAEIVATSPVPVVAAGGPKADSLAAALDMMSEVVRSGARGATIGRNIWGDRDPLRALLAFKCVLHEGLGSEEALRRTGSPATTETVREMT